MKTRFTLLKSLTLASILMPLMLVVADEGEEHVPVGIRPSTESPATEEPREETGCSYIFDRYPQVYLPTTTHWFSAVSALGDSAVLEDGSVWLLSSYDGEKALNWIAPEPLDPSQPKVVIALGITQNFSWFSNYQYRIINKGTGESIAANLQLGPVKENPYTRFVTGVDPASGTLVLSDNTHFQVSPSDKHKMPALFDYIITGQNGGWSSSYESILINVNMDNYVHAKQI